MADSRDTSSPVPTELKGDRLKRRPKPPHPIEVANNASDEEFIKEYLKPSEEGWPKWTQPRTGDIYTLSLTRPRNMGRDALNACFNLVDETSGDAYRSSSMGWHIRLKKSEMQSPDLRYITVRDTQGVIKAFTSMMPTFENGQPVVYCFEIHLKPELQGTGLGTHLMGYLMDVAENIPGVEKVMLTCFTSNTSGLRFYGKLGFDKDDFSPRERKLRGGKTVTPDYVILSRRTDATAHGRRPGNMTNVESFASKEEETKTETK